MKRTFGLSILIVLCLLLFSVFAVKSTSYPSGICSIEAADVVAVDGLVLPILLVTYKKATVPQIRATIFVKEKTPKTINRLYTYPTAFSYRDQYHMRC